MARPSRSIDYIIGLGGRDVRKKDIREVVTLAEKGKGDQFYRPAQRRCSNMADKTCELFDCGHRACGGCGAALASRLMLKASGKEYDRRLSDRLHGSLLNPLSRRPRGKSRGSTRSLKTSQPLHQVLRHRSKNRDERRKSSSSEETARRSISGCSASAAHSNAATISPTSATITRHT